MEGCLHAYRLSRSRIVVGSSAPWLYCLLTPRAKTVEPAHLAAFPKERTGNISLPQLFGDPRPKEGEASDQKQDRVASSFPVCLFFSGLCGDGGEFRSFLRDIFNGRFGVPMKDAKGLSALFTKRVFE